MVRAATLVATDRGLLRSSLLPTGLTFLGSAALAAFVAWRREGRFLELAFASFVALSSMPPTLLWPLWTRLGKEARRAVGATPGEEERPGERYARLLVRETTKAVRQGMVVAIGLGPGEPTWFERGLGALAARSRWLRILRPAGRFVGWLARPWRHQAAFTERHPWESAGFGLASVAVLAVPVLGVFFRAVAITAATALVVQEEPPGPPVKELAPSGDPA